MTTAPAIVSRCRRPLRRKSASRRLRSPPARYVTRMKCKACSRRSKASTRAYALAFPDRCTIPWASAIRSRQARRWRSVESNASLTDYVVTAPFAGTILDRSATQEMWRGEEALFELADLSTLWVDLHLFGADAQHITAGLPVQVVRLSDEAVATTKLERILPGTATASQSTIARATIRNDDGRWRPGTAVRARVTVSERPADRRRPSERHSDARGTTVVFVRSAETYTARPVRLGDRDAERVEVLDGVELGEEVVVEQSYLIKADIEKAGAAHEH